MLKLAGLETSVLIPSALAISQLVLPDERELECIADIGIGTIDTGDFRKRTRLVKVMPMGGELLMHDLRSH